MRFLLVFFFCLGISFIPAGNKRKPQPFLVEWKADSYHEPKYFMVDSVGGRHKDRVDLWYQGKILGNVDFHCIKEIN